MVGPVAQPHHFERRLDVLAAFAPRERRKRQRQFDVFVSGKYGNQIVELEDEADVLRTPPGQFALG
jgi:hypothetical protein